MSLFPISALYKQHADIHSPPLAIGIHFAKTCLSWHAGTGTAYTLDGAFNYVSACLSVFRFQSLQYFCWLPYIYHIYLPTII